MTEVTIKRKITAKPVAESVALEFPRYSRHDYDGDGWSTTHYCRLDADGTFVDITRQENGWEIESKKISLAREVDDYYLGTSADESSAKEFNAAGAALLAFIEKAGITADREDV
jgi:hypothetical protein